MPKQRDSKTNAYVIIKNFLCGLSDSVVGFAGFRINISLFDNCNIAILDNSLKLPHCGVKGGVL